MFLAKQTQGFPANPCADVVDRVGILKNINAKMRWVCFGFVLMFAGLWAAVWGQFWRESEPPKADLRLGSA
jgi:hypothetical protein